MYKLRQNFFNRRYYKYKNSAVGVISPLVLVPIAETAKPAIPTSIAGSFTREMMAER